MNTIPAVSAQSVLTTVLSGCTLAAFTACGGGDPAPNPIVQPASRMESGVTPANFGDLAHTVVHAARWSVGATFAALTAHELALGSEPLDRGQPVARALGGGSALTLADGPGVPGGPMPTIAESWPCNQSGRLQFGPAPAEGPLSMARTGFKALWSECVDADGATVNGSLVLQLDPLTVTSGQVAQMVAGLNPAANPGTLPAVSLGRFDSLSFATAATSGAISGQGRIHLKTQATSPVNRQVDATVQMLAPGLNAGSKPSQDQTEFRVQGHWPRGSGSAPFFQVSLNGHVISPALQVQNPEPLIFASPYGFPTAGRLMIQAERGERIRIQVLPGGLDVSVELDADADGVAEVSRVWRWNEFTAR